MLAGQHIKVLLITAVLLLKVLSIPATADTIYVKADGSGDYPTIQDAIDVTIDGDEVVLMPGIYTGDGNRDLDFANGLPEGQTRAITVRSTNPEDPNMVKATIIDPNGTKTEPYRGFFFHSGEQAQSVVAGLTIRNGYSNDGGGIYCNQSSPTIRQSFIHNNTGTYGAGLYCISSNPAIISCSIRENHCNNYGGGIYSLDSSPTISNCTIIANSAGTVHNGVGGVYSASGSIVITNCVVKDNKALSSGSSGAFRFISSNAIVNNCIVTGNVGEEYGGFNISGTASITNCTITENNGVINSIYGGTNVTVTNCIIWGGERNGHIAGSPTVTYSNVQGGHDGEGNIDADPGFAFDSDFRLMPDSACVDTGTNNPPGGLPATDIEGIARPSNGIADMGAYEYDSQNPRIALEPASLYYYSCFTGGPNPNDQILSVRNAGIGNLNWTVTEDYPWLKVNPTSGDSTGEIDQITVSVDTSGLSPGIYTSNLLIFDPEASNNPQEVGVILLLGLPQRIPSEYPTIQSAVDVCNDGDVVIIAPGIYTGEGNRDIDFQGKAITVRSIDPYNTEIVASTIIDCNSMGRGFYFHSGEKRDSILSGLTIIRGSAGSGAAINCSNSSPKIHNCNISHNTSPGSGGGVYLSRSGAIIIGCTVTDNVAEGVYKSGGGIYCADDLYKRVGMPAIITDCIISRNSANKRGGGICAEYSWLRITNSVISNNRANYEMGGGVCLLFGDQTIRNCIITGNSTRQRWQGGGICAGRKAIIADCIIKENIADGAGGGIYLARGGNPQVLNCVISGNRARGGKISGWIAGGGGIRCRGNPTITNCTIVNNTAEETGGALCSVDGAPELTNCILWNNDNTQIYLESSSLNVSFSDVKNGLSAITSINGDSVNWGPGNIDVDPLFADPNENLRLLPGSPCIDAGDSDAVPGTITTDIDGLPRFYDDVHTVDTGNGSPPIVDMGAYEFMPCDFEPDGDIDGFDFISFILSWLDTGCSRCSGADLTGEGDVDLEDFTEFSGFWLAGLHIPAYPVDLQLEMSLNDSWMYQNLPTATDSNLTANVSIIGDQYNNSSYTYDWEFILPDDVSIPPTIIDGGTADDPFCTFAAPNCNEPNGLSDSGQPFTVRVTVTGDDYGNMGIAEAQFGIALLGDVNNDTVVNDTDREIINSFWRTGEAGPFTFRDCNLNCDTAVNVGDRSIANAIWRGALCQNSVSNPCPFR